MALIIANDDDRALRNLRRRLELEHFKAIVRGIYSNDKLDPNNKPFVAVWGLAGISLGKLVKKNLITMDCAQALLKIHIQTLADLLMFKPAWLSECGIKNEHIEKISEFVSKLNPDVSYATESLFRDQRRWLFLGMDGARVEYYSRRPQRKFLDEFPDFRTKNANKDKQGKSLGVDEGNDRPQPGYTKFKFTVPELRDRFLTRCKVCSEKILARCREDNIDVSTLIPPYVQLTEDPQNIPPPVEKAKYLKSSGERIYTLELSKAMLHLLANGATKYPNIIQEVAVGLAHSESELMRRLEERRPAGSNQKPLKWAEKEKDKGGNNNLTGKNR